LHVLIGLRQVGVTITAVSVAKPTPAQAADRVEGSPGGINPQG
jgi:hypothetical protein